MTENILESISDGVSTALLIDEHGKASGGAETFRDLREIEELKERLQEKAIGDETASRNPEMRKLFELLPMIAESSISVLIRGETGTGKEVMARMIHRLSAHSKGPFIAVNCGALPDTLLESELFGYKKGAFTGADKDKAGRFKLAENGTLFLDEIGDISPALQVKLLRVLQEREYEALGSTATEKTNARVICATNRNLKERVEQGLFRHDLYYRINVIDLALPALRDRKEDIPRLAEHFLRFYARQSRKTITGFTPEVFAAFYAYAWPGNIRELENVIERAVVLCGNKEIDASLLPGELIAPTASIDTSMSTLPRPAGGISDGDTHSAIRRQRQDAEKTAIIAALERRDFQCSKAAFELGIDNATLYRKIKTYGIVLTIIRKQDQGGI
ncbi:MAG: sigma 54-interacting transcriptional regulator [Treponemataceae bacterium]